MSAPLSIGIVCFPSLGGSGIVATELAVGLSLRGHRVHVITSAPPSRTLPAIERLTLHVVAAPSHPALQDAPYALALASRIVEIAEHHGLDIVHVHYALPHAASAYLARQVLGPAAPRIITTFTAPTSRRSKRPRYRSITRFTVTRSDGVAVPSVPEGRGLCRLGSGRRSIIPSRRRDHFTPHSAIARTSTRCRSAGGDRRTAAPPCSFVSSFHRSARHRPRPRQARVRRHGGRA
jgi:glycosyltransferase involved in cell wall biosynthesis